MSNTDREGINESDYNTILFVCHILKKFSVFNFSNKQKRFYTFYISALFFCH